MSDDRLTDELARQIFGWKVAPDRFLMSGRQWVPRWRFQPVENLIDAFRLLEAAAPQEYTMGAAGRGDFWVRVKIAGVTGSARAKSKPRAITTAVARALGIEAKGRS